MRQFSRLLPSPALAIQTNNHFLKVILLNTSREFRVYPLVSKRSEEDSDGRRTLSKKIIVFSLVLPTCPSGTNFLFLFSIFPVFPKIYFPCSF